MNRKVFSKLSKKKKRIVIVLMLFIVLDLALLTITSLPFTRAFFQSNANSSVDLDIAKFSFLVNGKINEEVSIDLESTLDDNYTKVIPGSSGVITLNLDASASEVNIRNVIKINRESTPDNLKIYKDAEHRVEINESIVEIINYKEEKDVKLYWKWVFTEDDENNWMDKQISININVTGEQIINEEDEIPYEESTLAYNIIKNAMKALPNTISTIYSEEPLTKPAQEISGEEERTLSITADDYGNSYYFRGNVQDNYLNFNDMCFRIVRIEGDGSIKLILEDQTQTCETATGGVNASIGQGNYGYTGSGTSDNPYIAAYELGTAKLLLDNWIKNVDNSKLKEDDWCLGNNKDWYDSEGNLTNDLSIRRDSTEVKRWLKDKSASLLCNNENDKKIKDYVALLTLDEVLFAGLSASANSMSYLPYSKENSLSLLLTLHGKDLLTEYNLHIASLIEIWGDGTLYQLNHLIPSIVLKFNTKLLNGNGTKSNPYTV